MTVPRELPQLARRHRRSSRRYFIDKIRQLAISRSYPNAIADSRIIDVRRNPLDCCFANYAQNYGAGVAYSYDQRSVARYYADYVRLVRHFEPILAGRFIASYAEIVNSPAKEIRQLIAFLGLEFEDSCLRFFETKGRCTRLALNRCGNLSIAPGWIAGELILPGCNR